MVSKAEAAGIGVLALQGAFEKHAEAVRRLGRRPVYVRTPSNLEGLAGLIIPGGESSVIGKLLKKSGLDDAVKAAAASGLPVFGTCAGMILLSASGDGRDVDRLSLMDIAVRRNAYGRQRDSFSAEVSLGEEFGDRRLNAMFIRAPKVLSFGDGVRVLGRLCGEAVILRQGNLLAASFHPELSGDDAVHRYFIDKMC